MRCYHSSYERSVRHVHIESCERVHMSAYMQHGLYSIRSIELLTGRTDSSYMQSQSMQCCDSSYKRSVRHVHIESSEWVHMSAPPSLSPLPSLISTRKASPRET